MMRRDITLLNGLATAGFVLNSGPEGSGLEMTYLSQGWRLLHRRRRITASRK